jgi:hypothetical protein
MVAEVRKCAGKGQSARPQERGVKPLAIYKNLSDTQRRYLRDLLAQFNLVLSGDLTVDTISYHDGKKILEGMIAARRLNATGRPYTFPDGVLVSSIPKSGGERTPKPPKLPDVPPGYYAVPDWTGKEEFKFFRVKVMRKGQWRGRTFVDQVIGGHPELSCSHKLAIEAVNHILEFGIEDAGMLYGLKIKQCCRCNRSLTKKASRVLSMGRHCAYQRGKGEEWDDLNYKFNDADAEDDEL